MNREWRCQDCGTLLGVDRQGGLYLRYKQVQYTVTGQQVLVTAVCRNCSFSNELRTMPSVPN